MNDRTSWFLTFRTYGTWLPGDARGWVKHGLTASGTPRGLPAPGLERYAAGLMAAPSRVFGDSERAQVDSAMRATCAVKMWELHALNVRTNHVHAVVTIDVPPDRAMVTLKAWSTRELRVLGAEGPIWARHGSTRHLPNRSARDAAVLYTLEGQGEKAD